MLNRSLLRSFNKVKLIALITLLNIGLVALWRLQANSQVSKSSSVTEPAATHKLFKWVGEKGPAHIGRLNNQLLMDICGAYFAEKYGRYVIGQPFNLNSDEKPVNTYVPFHWLLRVDKGLTRYFEIDYNVTLNNAYLYNRQDDIRYRTPETDDYVVVDFEDYLYQTRDVVAMDKVAVQIDDIAWFYCFHMYAWCNALRCSLFHNFVDLFVFNDKIMNKVESFIKQNHLERSIGVHLRAGDKEYACRSLTTWFTDNLLYSCYQADADEIIANIEALRHSASQPVFVATNHKPDSPIMKRLEEYYGPLLIRLPHLGELEYLRGIIESLLLSRTHWLLGNWYSTYTGNAVLRRHYFNVAYFKTYNSFLGIFPTDYLKPLIPVVLFLTCIWLIRTAYRVIWNSTLQFIEAALIVGKIWLFGGAILTIMLYGIPFEVLFRIIWFFEAPFICFFTRYCHVSLSRLVKFLFKVAVVVVVVLIAARHNLLRYVTRWFNREAYLKRDN